MAKATFRSEEINDLMLTSILEGEAPQDLVDTVRGDQALTDRLQSLQQESTRVNQLLGRNGCPSGEELMHFTSDLLAGEHHTFVKMHLNSCHFCQGEMNELQHLKNEPLPSFEPAVDTVTQLMDWAKKLGRRLIEATFLPQLDGVGLVAVRGLEPATGDPAVPMTIKGGTSEWEGHFEADGSLIELTISQGSTGEHWEIRGEVEPREGRQSPSKPTTVHLLRERVVSTEDLDSFGNFEFYDIPPGNYILRVDLGQDSLLVRLPPIG